MIDGINNIATQIFSKLDSQDSKGTDDKIEASIWNKFVSDKGGKEIHNYITKERAVKSIIRYLTNMSQKLGCTVEELANQWLGKSKANSSEISGEKSKLNSKSVDVPAIVVDGNGDSDEQNVRFQTNVNDALQLVSDVANGKYKYSISKVSDEHREIKLTDGRTIRVTLKKEYQTDKVYIDNVHVATEKSYGKQSQKAVDFFRDNGGGAPEIISWDIGQEVTNGAPSKSDLDELYKVIINILGEDIEII